MYGWAFTPLRLSLLGARRRRPPARIESQAANPELSRDWVTEIEAYERDLALKSRERFRRFSGPSCKLCGSCVPRQRALAAQVSLLGLRQDITEDEPRPPNDFADLDPDGARENRPLEHKRVELAVFTARVHAFR
jgi:hypothetical protein